ncbi:MAG TPA: DUF2382 domain-containing protein [Casimicrobiaceae bacterium]|jgi:uncharacterized protein (TIGR02271 family)
MNVPVLAESARVERRRRETGRVRVAKRVSVTERVVDEPVYRDDARVERRRVDRVVTTLPRIRTEGDTTIVPVLEEVLVLEKRVVLREEIRITRVRAIGRARRRVALRTENASIERVDAAAPRKVAKRMG